ncbi:Cytochrome P450 3A24 [Araneus ventricosus]|uniref:Cytochrome P450 3A24 n=1 Tax=Araneus ventricosus TaxID=182803 RepID=A0A4Y2EDI8_ARAVE|nr:Cytochrome P450 3A24 [Araneus ventricosus]
MLGTELFDGPLFVVFVVGLTTALFYWYSTKNFDYWKKRNVPYVAPIPFVGTVIHNIIKPLHESEIERYKKLGRVYGHFEGTSPLLTVGDPTLLRNILVKDFHHFPSRRITTSGNGLFATMVANIQGEDWKRIRAIISPIFSSGKIKKLMSIMKECADISLIANFRPHGKTGASLDVKRIYGAYAMDVLARSAFSVKIDTYHDSESPFVKTALKAFRKSISPKYVMFQIFPRLMKMLGIPFYEPEVFQFFQDVSMQIVEDRKRTGQTSNDFVQILLDTSKELSEDPKSELNEKETEDVNATYGGVSTKHQVFKNASKKSLSHFEVVAQCVVFFLAGYDATVLTLSHITYMLALHPDIQDQLREDLKQTLKETDGEVTYDSLQSVKLLDNIVSETLRILPPSVRIERQCAVDYELGEQKIPIKKGMIITIPVYAMHRDSEFFPDAEKFDPDRWSAENKQKLEPYIYLPFGLGPRNCVGMRFALTEIKVAIAYAVLNFNIKRSPKTKVPLNIFSSHGLLQSTEIHVALEERTDCPVLK